MSNESITPPLSPVFFHAGDEVDLPPAPYEESDVGSNAKHLFSCKGPSLIEVSEMVGDHLLSVVQGNDACPQELLKPYFTLFGFLFPVESPSDPETVVKQFSLIRQKISSLSLLDCSFSGTNHVDALSQRVEIVKFFCILKANLYRHSNTFTEHCLNIIIEQLKALVLHLGSLAWLSSSVQNAYSTKGNNCQSVQYHILHMHLDARLHILEIINIIEIKFSALEYRIPTLCHVLSADVPEYYTSSLSMQYCILMLWDLMNLAARIYGKDCTDSSPFNCSCIQEFWILIIKFLDSRSTHLGTDSFWGAFHRLTKIILLSADAEEKNDEMDSDITYINCNSLEVDGLGFIWWLIRGVALLYTVKFDNKEPVDNQIKSNYLTLAHLLKLVLSNENTTEKQLRTCLAVCIELSHLWEPNLEAMNLLWDFFSKKLNSSYLIPGHSVEDIASVNKSVPGWIKSVEDRINLPVEKHQNSFKLFLKLLSIELIRDGNCWKKLKGRFFSKFHQRKMQQLTETGWNNVFNLFLTLAHTSFTQEIIYKLVDLLDMTEFNPQDQGKFSQIWLGCFAVLYLGEQKHMDTTTVALKISDLFYSVCRELAGASSHVRRAQLWELICVYLESLKELRSVPSSLIGTGFTVLFSQCREQELRKVLSVLHELMLRYQSDEGLQSNNDRGTVSALWKNIFPFVKQKGATPTPPLVVVDLAVAFTHLSLNFPSLLNDTRETPASIFQYFTFEESISSSFCCRFFRLIAEDADTLEKLTRLTPNANCQIIQAWFRCCMQTSPQTDRITGYTDLQEFTSFVLKMEAFTSEFQAGIPTPITHDNPHSVAVAFIKTLSIQFQQSASLIDKRNLQIKAEGYFGGLIKHINQVLKSNNSVELKTMYWVIGRLVKNCAALLYIRSNPGCIFPKLIDRMIIPHSVLKDKSFIHSGMTEAIRDNLCMFLLGFGQLDVAKDPYVSRRLGDLIKAYLNRFPMQSGNRIHPFLEALKHKLSTNALKQFIMAHIEQMDRTMYQKCLAFIQKLPVTR